MKKNNDIILHSLLKKIGFIVNGVGKYKLDNLKYSYRLDSIKNQEKTKKTFLLYKFYNLDTIPPSLELTTSNIDELITYLKEEFNKELRGSKIKTLLNEATSD